MHSIQKTVQFRNELGQERDAKSDPVPASDLMPGMLVVSPAAVDEVAGIPGVQKECASFPDPPELAGVLIEANLFPFLLRLTGRRRRLGSHCCWAAGQP